MNERPDTKTKILDAAEKLFGEKGFDATSLRDITTEADVNLAAVNYHFQSKESLIEATIMRAAGPVNEQRIAMLEAAGPKPTVEQILEAFVGPVLEQDFEPMAPLMARVLASPEIMQRVFKRHMETRTSRVTFDENEAYDTKAGKWRKLAALPTGRHGFAAAAVGNTLYFVGGSTECGSGGRLNDNLAFTLP